MYVAVQENTYICILKLYVSLVASHAENYIESRQWHLETCEISEYIPFFIYMLHGKYYLMVYISTILYAQNNILYNQSLVHRLLLLVQQLSLNKIHSWFSIN